MLELKGKYNTAKVFTDNIEQTAISQIIELCNQPFVEGGKIRIMPDCHYGSGCVIGFTADLGDKVIPNIVGVDIGCFTGDTKIPLLNGTQRTLKELSESKEEFWVYSINEKTMIVPGKAKALKTRNKSDLVLVEISSGGKIKCTPDHNFLLRDGTYKQAKDLKYKDSLMPLYRIYQTRDGYESLFNPGGRSCLTHKMVAEYFLGKCPKGYVAHHKDENQFNNEPNNLEYITIEEHNSYHGKRNSFRLKSTEFKQHRKGKLKENGYYDKRFTKKKKEIGIINITNYMENNPEDFEKVVKENAKRGSRFFKLKNEDSNMIIRQKLGKIRKVLLQCIEKGRNITKYNYNKYKQNNSPYYNKAKEFIESCGFTDFLQVIDKENWNKYIFNNHKVISIHNLNYKEDVYCLQVQEYHNFALTDGIFVHNCGMGVFELGKINIDLQKLDDVIREFVPSGRNTHKNRISDFDEMRELHCYRSLKDTKRIEKSIGTLGGGNHFIEVNKDSNDNLYLVIHSGSRNLGKQVAEYYQNIAIDLCSGKSDFYKQKEKLIADYKQQGKRNEIHSVLKELEKRYNNLHPSYPKDLCFLSGEWRDKYLHDMKLCQEYATLNRYIIADIILLKLIKIGEITAKEYHNIKIFETIHNYINFKDNIIRKGAISAYEGEKVLIPINMRDGSILAIGKGNVDWNYSAPHGAGRLMSRSKAKENISMKDYQESMKDIFTNSVSTHTIDEAPMAYKSMDEIISNIGDTVEIIDIIKPIYNYKAGE